MKNLSLYSLLLLLVAGIVFISCQQEEFEFLPDEVAEGTTILKSDYKLTDLLIATVRNNGEFDEFIDGSSCSSIQFPYQVVVNGQTLSLQDKEDVKALKGSSNITIVFPITIVFEDYSTMVVNSPQQLNAIAAQCNEEVDIIYCADLSYPISIITYNIDLEQRKTVTINDDRLLHSILTGLTQDDVVSINYPLEIVFPNGSSETAIDNNHLLTILENCDDKGQEVPVEPTDLENYLITGSWYVSLWIHQNDDKTSDFEGYKFVFNPNGSAVATSSSDEENGTWAITITGDDEIKLNLGVWSNNSFDKITEDWDVTRFDKDYIMLEHNGDRLIFSREPTISGGNDIQRLKDILQKGQWEVNLFVHNFVDKTDLFETYTFNFNTSNNKVIATSGTGKVTEGTCGINYSGGRLSLSLTFSPSPLNNLNIPWKVDSSNNFRVESSTDDDWLVFVRM